MIKYIAFLCGINVGGNKKVPMTELKNIMEKIGFSNVRTILATGNVIFDSPKKNTIAIKEIIEKKLHEIFGFEIKTLVYSMLDIIKLFATDPFKGIQVTKETRLYVTFLSHKPKSIFKTSHLSPDKLFGILKVTDIAIFSVLLTKDARSVDTMNFIDKEFGKDVTTRNWNTITKILSLT